MTRTPRARSCPRLGEADLQGVDVHHVQRLADALSYLTEAKTDVILVGLSCTTHPAKAE
jgi:hypothetical protein